MEDRDHLIFQCDFYGRLWYLNSGWLGFSFVSQGALQDDSLQFGGLRGFSKKFQNIIQYCLDFGTLHYLEGSQ